MCAANPSGGLVVLCCLLMWFLGIVAGWDYWLPSSFGCLPAPSGTMEARIRKEVLRSVPAEGSLGPVSEVCGIFINRYLPNHKKVLCWWCLLVCFEAESIIV